MESVDVKEVVPVVEDCDAGELGAACVGTNEIAAVNETQSSSTSPGTEAGAETHVDGTKDLGELTLQDFPNGEGFFDGTKPARPEGFLYKDSIPERFVQGLKNDPPGTDMKRWQETLRWRTDQKVDAILDEKQPHYFKMREYYTSFYHGRAKDGSIVYYERLGKHNTKGIKELGTMGDWIRLFVYLSEFLWRVLDPSEDGQLVSVYDFEGVSMGELYSGVGAEIFRAASAIYQAHYVERAGRILIVNSPWWIQTAWKVAKTFVHPNTQAKVTVMGSSFKTELCEFIDEDQIPTMYGGKSPLKPGESDEEKKIEAWVNYVNSLKGLTRRASWM